MTKKLEIIIDGKREGSLEVDEVGNDDVKLISFEIPNKIREKLQMTLFNENGTYGFPLKEYIATIQRGMEHYLEKKIDIIEY